ncbi:MAG: hypothetical protein WBL28_08730 [Methylotenera sp.]
MENKTLSISELRDLFAQMCERNKQHLDATAKQQQGLYSYILDYPHSKKVDESGTTLL